MAHIYTLMYVERQPDGSLRPPPYPMRFDMTINEWWADLGCVRTTGDPNPNATTVAWSVVGDRKGNFAVCALDVPDGWFGQYQKAQADHEAIKDSLAIAPTEQALTGRCTALVVAMNAYLDQAGIPHYDGGIVRATRGLLELDLSAHHPRFEDIRSAYVDTLSKAPTADFEPQNFWLPRFLDLTRKIDEHNHAIDFDTLGAMHACMTTHDELAACRSMHYVYQLGALSTYLNSP